MPDTYTIFITENDIFKKGLPFYPVERMNMATNELFGDGEHILYVNGAYRGEDEIGKLMHDFSCSDPDDMINQDLADRTRYYKETEEGVSAVCKVMEDMRNEAKKEEHFDTVLNNIKNLMESVKWSAEQAMDALKIPTSERSMYLKQL